MKYKSFLTNVMITISAITVAQTNGAKSVNYNSPFISGKVILNNKDVYSGTIKLGNNDLLWTNLFSAEHKNDENVAYIPDTVLKTRKNYSESTVKWIVGIPFGDMTLKEYNPYFICDYGVIASINKHKDYVSLKLQSNETIELNNKTGDLSNDIYIYSSSSTEPLKIKWRDISAIQFENQTGLSSNRIETPLYGELRSKESTEIGFVDWDQQEKTNSDMLNGRNNEGSFEIPFNHITSIINTEESIMVNLKSGSSFKATGNIFELFTDLSNDLGTENRGIIITKSSVGKISCDWESFKQISFSEPLYSESAVLISFPYPKKLEGEIKTKDGKSYKGVFAFNIYKERNSNYLIGNDIEGLSYAIPFWNISKIEPKDEHSTNIFLKNNEKLILGNSPDVTNENDGVIIFDKNPKYISWSNISEIIISK